MTIQKPITLHEAKSIVPRWDESTVCYAVDLEDAVNAAVAMARKREL